MYTWHSIGRWWPLVNGIGLRGRSVLNTFFKNNTNHYKIKSDNQRKYLNIHNVIKFRNILFDYCNSLDLSELKYEIEKK
jgi:hypothetical protein